MLKVINEHIAQIPLTRESAAKVCKLIPASCPFARTFRVGPMAVKVPPLCKLNPVYSGLTILRFRAECLLVECNENV